VSRSSLSDTLFGTLTGSLCSVCSVYRLTVAGSIHLGLYLLGLEKELMRHIHVVALFIDHAHVELGASYIWMVLSIHLDPDLRLLCIIQAPVHICPAPVADSYNNIGTVLTLLWESATI